MSGPVIDGLVDKARKLLAQPPQGHACGLLADSVDQRVAEVCFATIREHFKDGLKSSNKDYDDVSPPDSPAVKARNAASHDRRALARQAQVDLTVLSNASLEERTAAKFGNCTELTALAVAIARRLGCQANAWAYTEDGEHYHSFCVVGKLSIEQVRRALNDPPNAKDAAIGAQRLWIVDAWSGTCCDAASFDDRFRAKMLAWADAGKVIQDDSEWIRPDAPAWTRVSGFKKELVTRSTIPGYQPQ